MGATDIEWATDTWNPVTGCTPISAGCAYCYAARMAKRLRGRFGYPADDPFRVTFHPDRLEEPLYWKKPSRIFVCSMADLFHEDVKDEWIDKVFAVMALCPQHTFMVLTKRPERMADYYADPIRRVSMIHKATEVFGGLQPEEGYFGPTSSIFWPLLNIQLGVTCENQVAWKERKEWLLKCPARVRFVSAEPLLSDIQFGDLTGIHGIIAGGCTGPGAPPTHPDAFRSVRDQCAAAGVPFFFKSWGEWLPDPLEDWGKDQVFKFRDGKRMFRHGYLARKHEPKKLRLLDGREHNELPEGK